MSTRQTTSDEAFAAAVAASTSMAETLRAIGLVPAGGNYHGAYRRIRRNKLDTSHWKGQGYSKGSKRPLNSHNKIPLENLLIENSTHGLGSHKLKLRLWSEGVLAEECSICHLKDWLGQRIGLQLDHINGDSFDNRIENLRILCPNCHSQTETYCGRNVKKPEKKCSGCGIEIQRASRTCGRCAYVAI